MRKVLQLFLGLSVLLLLLPAALQAQERTIAGTIISEDNKAPLSGVTVRVKGTRRIVQTDASGKFSIKINPGETLQITYVGYQTEEVKPGDGATVGVSMRASDNTMGEVVVTAMDIKRSPRSLGYAAQGVDGKDIAETQRENFLNSLQGRVAGLTINPTSGQAGASSQIVLRGFNSLSLNNQPLFVMDGIILDNSTINETSNGGTAVGLASDRPNRNNDYTNRIADINPSDIESITVLKGPEATALYGSQASGGAIVITTKKAVAGKLSIAYDNSFRVQEVTRYADLNNDYGPGTNAVPGNSFSAPTASFNFSYFGPRYPAGTQRYKNIDAFFRTGFAQTHNLSADVGFKNVGFKISGSYFANKGVVPSNDYKKYSVRITNSTKIGKNLEITPSFQFVHSQNDKPLRSAGGYLLGLYVWPDTRDVTTYQDADGNKINVFQSDPTQEIDNPMYNTLRNHAYDETNRMIFSGGINFTPFKWLSVNGRFGYDTYKSNGYTFYHPLSSLTSRAQRGALDNFWRRYHGYNHTITATAKKDFGKFSTRIMVGTMWQDYETQMFAIYGTGLVDSIGLADGRMYKFLPGGGRQVVTDATFDQIIGPRTDSSITTPATRVRLLRNRVGEYNRVISRQNAFFGEVGISWKNMIFFSYTHRFEASSVFIKANRNYNYPGASMSFILSDLFPMLKSKTINYWKFRASLANTARLADPYKNQSVFVDNFTSSTVGQLYSYSFDNNVNNLKPERQSTYEIGTEIRLLNSRLNFDFTYYNTYCKDQISSQSRASYATGYVLNTLNAASTRNQGIEVITDIGAVRKKDFSWNIKFNFNKTWSEVLKLPEAIYYEFYIADTWLYGNARGGLVRNNPSTTITGFHYMRNNKGQVLISPTTGLPIVEGTFTIIGDRNPDFTLGTTNSFRYKNFNLSFLWDLKMGGDIFNATEMYLTYAGKSQRTADREKPRIVEGVLQDGMENSPTPTVNTMVVNPFYQQTYYTSMPEEEFVEKDVNWFRLRDITLNYTLPAKLLGSTKVFKSLGVFITGNDLVLLTNYRGADPSSNGNTAGSNGVGGFAFDYGNLPSPMALNFGIKAIFK